MKYKQFNIAIDNFLGVSKVGRDTLALALIAGRTNGKRVLDVGTGTGFVAIYLASLGKKVEAADISTTSVEAARQNAKINKVDIKVYQSDLFKSASGKYDLITFNPPIGTSSSAQTVVFIERLKSVLPKSDFLFKIGLIFLGNQRRNIIKRFLKEARLYLSERGKIVMLLAQGEEKLIHDSNYKIQQENGIQVFIIDNNSTYEKK